MCGNLIKIANSIQFIKYLPVFPGENTSSVCRASTGNIKIIITLSRRIQLVFRQCLSRVSYIQLCQVMQSICRQNPDYHQGKQASQATPPKKAGQQQRTLGTPISSSIISKETTPGVEYSFYHYLNVCNKIIQLMSKVQSTQSKPLRMKLCGIVTYHYILQFLSFCRIQDN